MLEHSLQSLVNFLHAHPHWGGVFAFAVSLIESLAIIGTIVPGSITMTGVGALVGAGVLPGIATFVWAIAGAYCGDCVSYWFGIHFNERLRNMWPFSKYGKLLSMGEEYFRKHGGKSIVIGRFVGPIRSLIPLIAGLLKMSPSRFLPFALVSAALWAIVYMLPGLLLGTLALELPPKVATQFVLLGLVAIALVWLIIWLIKYFIETCWEQIDRMFMRLWNYLNIHQRSHWVTQLLRNPAHEEDHLQLIIASGLLIVGCLFLWILFATFSHSSLTHLNQPIFNLLQSFRLKSLDRFAIAITLLGYVNLLLLVGAILLIILLLQRRFWIAIHWLALILLSAGAAGVLKKLVHEPRPALVQETIHTGSFPSGHVTLSTALFGFLAVIIAHHLPRQKRALPYWCATLLVALIAFSRMYLGAHWLNDILGGIFLGLSCVHLITLSYRRRTPSELSPARFSTIVGVLFLAAWIAFGVTSFKKFSQQFNPPVATETVLSITTWWQQLPGQFPLYRSNRVGSPAQPLNIQWLGSLATIEETLAQQGWQSYPPKSNLQGTLLRLSTKNIEQPVPILLGLYHNRNPKLLMTKTMDKDRPRLVLRLWQSDIHIDGSNVPLWLGTVQYYSPNKKLLHLPNQQQKVEELEQTTEALTPYLKDFVWRELSVASKQQPNKIQHLDWDGRVLLIMERD